jgi:hypothetical protein
MESENLFFRQRRLKYVRRTQIPFIIYSLSFIIYNCKEEGTGKKGKRQKVKRQKIGKK